jgi:PAS domain S-box-containing protein
MAAGAICALMIYLVLRWYTAQPEIKTNDLTPFATAMMLMCGSIAVTYALARWVSNDIASVWLLTTGVLVISISDAPGRIYTGPALVAYAVPILAAGVLLPAWTTFVFAGLSMVAVLTASLVAPIDIVPIPAMLVFLVIALITWYFAQSVERANQELSHANAELKRSEADFRLLFADNLLPMAVVDAHTLQVLEVNDAACEHYGYTREELYRIAPDAVLLTGTATGQEPAQTRWPYTGEQQHCTKDGRPIDMAIMANAIRYAGRDAILVIAQDITERKQAEQQLFLMRRVVEQSPVSIAIFTLQNELEFVNRKFIEMTGYTLGEVKNLPAHALRAPDQSPETGKRIEAALAAGHEWHGETRRQRKNGESFWEAVSISRVIDPTGTIVHHLAIAEDVTARHEAEDALRTLNAELEHRVEDRTAELRRAKAQAGRPAGREHLWAAQRAPAPLRCDDQEQRAASARTDQRRARSV